MVLIDKNLIIKINSCSFVGYIYFMIYRKIPDWESLQFSIPGFYSLFVFMVNISKTGGKFATTRSGAGYNYNGFCCFNIWICSITFITYNGINICRISFSRGVEVNFNSSSFQFVLKSFGRWLLLITGYNNCSNFNIPFSEIIYCFQGIHIIGNAKIGSDFFSFNITCMDT